MFFLSTGTAHHTSGSVLLGPLDIRSLSIKRGRRRRLYRDPLRVLGAVTFGEAFEYLVVRDGWGVRVCARRLPAGIPTDAC